MNWCVILNLLTLNISWSLDIKTSCSFVLQLDGSEEFRAFWAGSPNERIWSFIFSWKNAIILVCTDLEFIYGIRIFRVLKENNLIRCYVNLPHVFIIDKIGFGFWATYFHLKEKGKVTVHVILVCLLSRNIQAMCIEMLQDIRFYDYSIVLLLILRAWECTVCPTSSFLFPFITAWCQLQWQTDFYNVTI